MKFFSSLLLVLVVSTLCFSQNGPNRLAFGITGNGTKYFGEFTDQQFWLDGDAFLRYNISKPLSVSVHTGLGQLRIKLPVKPDPSTVHLAPGDAGYSSDQLFGRTSGKNFTRLSSFYGGVDICLLPREKFVPSIFIGGGILNFEPQDDNGNALPRNGAGTSRPGGYVKADKTTWILPVGLGFEAYLTDDLAINGGGKIVLTGTDYLDDVKSYEGSSESQKDFFLIFGVGLSYYVFGEQLQIDTDGDGLLDSKEKEIGTDPLNPDTDGDGLKDGEEYLTYHTNPLNPDTDGDGLKDGIEVLTYHTDPLKPDTDGDGLTDGQEVEQFHTDPLATDTDHDGLTDAEETKTYNTNPLTIDTDGDGLRDGDEVKQYKTNPLKADTDGDGLSDGDEVLKYKTNPLNTDTDNDGLSDFAEITKTKTDPLKVDTDGDGIQDKVDLCPTVPGVAPDGCPAVDGDSDGDGLSDNEERTIGTDPKNPNTDGDGLTDGAEYRTYHTDPKKTDTDGDGLKDGEEILKYKTDPLLPDTDGDGLKDGDEVHRFNTDPLKTDTDGDGIKDGDDKCPTVAGVAPDGCPRAKKETVANFPGVLFLVNTDAFNMAVPSTLENLNKIKDLVMQCPEIKVEIEGHASGEGDAKRNQTLSEERAASVKRWLVEQGVPAERIVQTVGYGSSRLMVPEPKKAKKSDIEAARKQNRRIAVRMIQECKG